MATAIENMTGIELASAPVLNDQKSDAPALFLTTSPGALKNDTTIYPPQ